ncbi:YgcG family protein [uncultured Kordia sp.]|uniref:TPM domain-containing protein n=1 Tax=uncultured Kordia sp. TaxID=507699 RepID=UPI00260934EF|nr:TPM domain-containing protein [uncultured Kordia sp.]
MYRIHYKHIFILCFVALFISCKQTKSESFPFPNEHYTNTTFPKPVGFINDFDSIFSEVEETNLLRLVKEHEAKTSNQIAVVTINDLKDYDDIEKYSLDLANYWGVGLKYKDNGVLITVHLKARKIWIQNGSGIEVKLTDAETAYIIESKIIPEFKRNDYYKGIYRGIEAIIKELTKEE